MIVRLSIVLFLILFFSCKKDPSLWDIKNLNGNKISVFGHGGMGINSLDPMDSYPSLKECLSHAVNGTEMDVCVTKDSVLVLSHSQKLEDQTGCTGMIENKTWPEISGCKYNSLLSKPDLIPASYFFDRIENKNNFTFTFDCKVSNEDNLEYLNLFADALVKHITSYNIVSNSFIESFNTVFLEILQKKNKNLHLFLYTQNYQTGLDFLKEINLYGLTLDYRKISAEEIAEAHKNNLRITIFNTQTEHENLEAIAKSPDFIQTDKVEYLINALK